MPTLATPEEVHAALEQAFDYRGDVLITRKDGTKWRVTSSTATRENLSSQFRPYPAQRWQRKRPSFTRDVSALAFSGRDMAAGKSWENWVKQYWEKKAAGETDISLQPEKLE